MIWKTLSKTLIESNNLFTLRCWEDIHLSNHAIPRCCLRSSPESVPSSRHQRTLKMDCQSPKSPVSLDFSPWHVYFGHTAILKESQNSVSRGCNQVTQLISACYRVEFYHLTLSEWSTVRPKNIFQFFNILVQVTCKKSNVLAVPLRLLFVAAVASGNQPWLAGYSPTVHYFPIKIPFVSDFPIGHVWLPKGVNQYSVHIPYPMNISLYHITLW